MNTEPPLDSTPLHRPSCISTLSRLTMIFTETQKQKLEQYLASHHIPSGLGTENEACSIAAINLAISGRLTDEIPDCMSLVVGKWIIRIQDLMPDSIRNSLEWKQLLPLAAGTGREQERERLVLILNWMWRCLEPLQPLADKKGFGFEWREMIEQKTSTAAYAAEAAAEAVEAAVEAAAEAVAYAAAADSVDADAYAAEAAAYAAAAEAAAAYAAKAAAYAAEADAAAYAAEAAAYAAEADAYAAEADAAAEAAAYAAAADSVDAVDAAAYAQYWATVVNPCALLQALCKSETLSETCS
jgi:hypothetical protein